MSGKDTGKEEQNEEAGTWEHQKLLGSGGFGTVSLWVNKVTGSKLAVKSFRMTSEMSARHRERWKIEVGIMIKLQHPNVVRAYKVPSQLLSKDEELPPLAMEYCSGGDLRRVLNRPENCNGLKEYQVRCILHDVGNGIEYLHENRISHRDIKPENVVLQNTPTDGGKHGMKIVYKIIDLGYAKDLDQGSLCTSFVGTEQYLAPELYLRNAKYTCTVDFWSFGILAFECIAGFRPFLPAKNPIQRHEPVRLKPDETIYIYENSKEEVKYSKNLPIPNHLCRTSQQSIENWLRLMLLWNPKHRGGGLSTEKRPKCFTFLENILNMKMVFVFCVFTNQLLSYPIQDQNTMAELQLVLEKETKIPVAEQELLLATGLSPDPIKPAEQCCTEIAEEEWLVYLFKKNCTDFPTSLLKRHLPDTVQSMIKEASALLTYQDQKKVWAHALYFCEESAQGYKRLTHAQRAAIMSLLRGNKTFSVLKTKVSEEVLKLCAQIDFFKQSLTSDMSKYEELIQSENLLSNGKETFKSWLAMDEEANKIQSLTKKVRSLDEENATLSTKILELQKSPFAKTKQVNKLDDIYQKARDLYSELKCLARELRNSQQLDNKKMIQCIVTCINERETVTQELYNHLSKIQHCRGDLNKIMPKLEAVLSEIKAGREKLQIMQEKRQTDVWSLVKQSLISGSQLSLSSNAHLNGSLVSSLTSSCEESLQLISESETERERLERIVSSLAEEIPQSHQSMKSLDWKFLTKTKASSSSKD